MSNILIPSEIGKVATRALAENGYTNLIQLVNLSEKDLLHLHGVGPKAIKIFKESFKQHGIKAVML